jgi:hypothetical protein
MKVIGHQHVGQNFCLVDVNGSFEKIEKGRPISVTSKNLLTGIATSHDNRHSQIEFAAASPLMSFVPKGEAKVKNKDLTPYYADVTEHRNKVKTFNIINLLIS